MKRRIVEIASLQVKDILTRSFFELQTRHIIVLEALQGDLTFVESSRWWAIRGNLSFTFFAFVLGHNLLCQLQCALSMSSRSTEEIYASKYAS